MIRRPAGKTKDALLLIPGLQLCRTRPVGSPGADLQMCLGRPEGNGCS